MELDVNVVDAARLLKRGLGLVLAWRCSVGFGVLYRFFSFSIWDAGT